MVTEAQASGLGETQLPSSDGILRRHHIGLMLSESPDSPYAVTGKVVGAFGKADNEIRARFLSDLDLLVNLMGASDLSGLLEATARPQRREINKRALSIYFPKKEVNDWKESARADKIEDYARTADQFINDYLRSGVWEPISNQTDMYSDVESANDIPSLLGIVFDTSLDDQARFEAKRKLVLMGIAASIDAKSGELREHDRYPEFQKFLNDFIWHRTSEGHSASEVTLLSKHDYDDYSVTSVTELTTEQEIADAHSKVARRRPKHGKDYLRLTPLKQRQILYKGKEMIPVYQDTRQKSLFSRIGKMIRKGEEDPSLAVNDHTGVLMVVRNNADAYKLMRHIASGGNSRSTVMKIEEVEDTLSGKNDYSAKNEGSSKKTRQLKFIARLEGAAIEMVIHTYDSYLDYLHQDDVAHEEFEIRRYVTSGAFELLFPHRLYGITSQDALEIAQRMRKIRRLPQY